MKPARAVASWAALNVSPVEAGIVAVSGRVRTNAAASAAISASSGGSQNGSQARWRTATIWVGGGGTPGACAVTASVCSRGRPIQCGRRGLAVSWASAGVFGSSSSRGGLKLRSNLSSRSRAPSSISIGALPVVTAVAVKRTRRRPPRTSGSASSWSSWYGRISIAPGALATTAPVARETASSRKS